MSDPVAAYRASSASNDSNTLRGNCGWPPGFRPGAGYSSLDLIAAIGEHRKIAFDSETGRRRRLAIASFRLRKTAENLLLERFGKVIERDSAPLAARLARREADPYSLAEELLDLEALTSNRHPEARAERASKDDDQGRN